MPRLSVILPAYNAEFFLERSAASVLGNTFLDLELIIIDDGSTDSTPELCEALIAADPRVRIIRQKNAGVSCARNKGIDSALGEYIAFVDADDYVDCTAYTEMFSQLDANKCDSALCGFYEEYPDGGRVVKSTPLQAGAFEFPEVQKGLVIPLLSDRLKSNLFLGTVWRYLFRADIIRSGNIRFSGAYLEDEVFLIEYFSQPGRLAVVDKPLYGYMQNPNSVTRRYLPTFIDTFMRTMEIKRELVEKFEIPVPDTWRLNSAWAGLLIAVSNEYAPGSPGQGSARVRVIAEKPLFAEAIANYKPSGMGRNKTLVAQLLRRRLYCLLGLLYTVKNSRR